MKYLNSYATRWLFLLTTVLVGTCLTGCDKSSPVIANHEVNPSGEEAVLQALDPYDPVYKLDEGGHVTNLKLEGRHIIPAVLDEVGKLTELTEMSLYAASITDDSLVKLQNLKKLTHLGLGTTFITDKGLVHLEKMESLQYLWLSKDRFSEKQLEQLKEKGPLLTVYLQ